MVSHRAGSVSKTEPVFGAESALESSSIFAIRFFRKGTAASVHPHLMPDLSITSRRLVWGVILTRSSSR